MRGSGASAYVVAASSDSRKLQEEKLQDRRRPPRTPPVHQSQVSPPVTSSSLVPSPARPLIKRLTAEELTVRCDKGICYHCDDKWIVGHRCRPRLHLLIADEDDDCIGMPYLAPSIVPEVSNQPQPPLDVPQISLNALSRMPTLETFRIYGTIARHQVIILVDGGSMHNFI